VRPELSPAARKRLLEVARRALGARVVGERFVLAENGEAELRRPAGAFVTVRRRADRELRACVGRIEPSRPLIEAVALAAAAAAAEDRRFDPLTAEELPLLSLEVSALGPLVEVAPESIEIGLHGVLVVCGERTGLLLPQVAVEYGLGREVFLQQACRKAGLPPDAWRRPGCEIHAFTATLISEED
jgi:AmmeMemoRadiSam system protein A